MPKSAVWMKTVWDDCDAIEMMVDRMVFGIIVDRINYFEVNIADDFPGLQEKPVKKFKMIEDAKHFMLCLLNETVGIK